ncbi:zinc-binding alcohol dehydrogenase [Brasilonema sp. UFV-L1]|uniref:zinc-dependent alcohol dehydrogenase n=1 Tax=Brasilonema sp. UFV-L1 TaxID=2234130 RepID=UPI00145FC99A|nr:zinc-binding alcohol dehydrogenase [Brasilonema sp. UFV-L1]NMG06239.1 dehydrogenase [Brasilonema sp. UFV-L1]
MSTNSAAYAYWLVSPSVGEIRETSLTPLLREPLFLETLYSGISPGTERLVGQAKVPEECWETMRCWYMEGSFALPLKYGYSLVGQAYEGFNQGKRFFVMHPHQSRVVVESSDALELPDWLPSKRATLIPNTETALNAVWDAEVSQKDSFAAALCADRILIVGAGIVGILISFVLSKEYGIGADFLEQDQQRIQYLKQLPWLQNSRLATDYKEGNYNIVFHTSASASGLQSAINALTFEGRCIELSWYGTQSVSLQLGGSFHYQRKQIIASQVSAIAKPMRKLIDYRQRKEQVLSLLADAAVDILLEPVISFRDLPQFMSQLYQRQVHPVSPLVEY